MAKIKRKGRGLSRKPNLTAIMINAIDTSALYGMELFGAQGQDENPSLTPKWSEVVINPRAYRKEEGKTTD